MKNEDKTPVCTGACLFGKCPNKVCVRYLQKKNAVQLKADMNILTDSVLPEIKSDKKGFGIAVDIGTTTVVAYLFDCESVKPAGVSSRLNSQASIGIDVISRIKYCSEQEEGLSVLNEAIITQVNSMAGGLCEQAGIEINEIKHMVFTGNTTMLHLLAKLSPVSMGVLPFEPASYFGDFYKASELGLDVPAKAYLTPCVSAFVGGDITTAILASGMFKGDELCALMDIGTNGEVAIGNKNGILATSTAAGPAFEGAHIRHGMAGVPGAINSVYVYKGSIETTTIGDKPAKGICGSGLLDAVALMIDVGLVDETGRISEASEVNEAIRKYIVQEDGMAGIEVCEGITITQKDIREMQTAKAAVAAGLKSLVHHAGRDVSDLEKVYLAGGFGNFMDADSAVKVGLLPKQVQGKIYPIGNAAGTGAIMALLNDKYKEECEKIARASKHVELGHNPYFMEQYVDNMYF